MRDEIKEWLMDHYEPTKLTRLDRYLIKPTRLKFVETDIEKFNEIYKRLLKTDLFTLARTKSGALSVCGKNKLINSCGWDIARTNSMIRITVIIGGYAWCFKMTGNHSKDEKSNKMSGSIAFRMFYKMCQDEGIDLEDPKYTTEDFKEAKEIKATIPKPLIKINPKLFNKVITNAHHLDYHSSYPSGLIRQFPEFTPVITKLYNGRKDENHPEYKLILNATIGYMQSTICRCRWVKLSKAAICDNNDRIINIAHKLISAKRQIIGYNTDGVWYEGEIYHDENEGLTLGTYANDHTNCTFRAKSDGCYEFIENGKYNPVVRGETKLDALKDRTEWEWGDIYKYEATVLRYTFVEGVGIVAKED